MNAGKIAKGVSELINNAELGKYRIDEKIAICRSAAELFQQVMMLETALLSLRSTVENKPD